MSDFTKSDCKCKFCTEVNSAIEYWDTYKPENNLQQRALDVVRKLEEQAKLSNETKLNREYNRELAFNLMLE